ncbi:glycosyltransferase family 2 protein [Cyanobium sp. FGCU-6]|jgi:glycosyltransferase involved in cell wall biosynthesis|nr:glycosyltransferase family 2 protein [Cyanobium sp. FGCU6]
MAAFTRMWDTQANMNCALTDVKSIALLVPCHNEAEGAAELVTTINSTVEELQRISWPSSGAIQFELIIVDDGSTDATCSQFEKLIHESKQLEGGAIISLSRNFGKEAAILAGLSHCEADACIIMDADLQDPPSLIGQMVDAWLDGHEVVNAVRNDRSSDSLMKRISSVGFYSLFLRLSKLEVQFNASDFRLLDRVAIEAIIACEERVRFSKGFFAWVGFKQKNIYFKRPARRSGQSKWGSWKLWNYALDGIFSFSTAPLRIWSYVGIVVTAVSFIVGLTAAIRVLFFGIDVPGYASLFSAVTFLGGLQLIGIGILGEYVGRSYLEAKRRPHYLIRGITRV